jgi:hypothetical protein
VIRGLLVGVWIAGAFAGVLMALGGLGLVQCGVGVELAGCSGSAHWPAWAELVVGLLAILFGILLGYGFGASALEELRRG